MISEDKIENNEILGGLEEMGLSKYESSAYYNLLGKGMISATEVAYSSNLPRSKIYSILKRLENKKLVLINNQKPLMCRAISPKEAFNGIITKYENKLNGLKKMIIKLQQINDEGLQSKGIEEKKYFVLNQFSTTSKIIDLIRKSHESIDAMINPLGNKLLIYSKDELKKTIIDGVRVRLICDIKCESENKILPNAIEQKFSQVNTNVFIFDNYNILILDSIGTKSALIHSNEIFLSTMMNQFNDLWFKLENNFLRSTNKIEFVNNI